MKEIKEDRFGGGIEEDDGIKIRIQESATTKKYWNNCVKRKQDFEHHVNKKKQKFDVHVASIL